MCEGEGMRALIGYSGHAAHFINATSLIKSGIKLRKLSSFFNAMISSSKHHWALAISAH